MKCLTPLTNWGKKMVAYLKSRRLLVRSPVPRKTEGESGLELVARILVGESGLDSVARTLLCCSLPSVGGISTFLRAGRAAENSTIYDRKSFCSASSYHKVTVL